MKIIIDILEEELQMFKLIMNSGGGNSAMRHIIKGTPLPKCNQCEYYTGAHNVEGHARCDYFDKRSVTWNDYCSRFKAEVKS